MQTARSPKKKSYSTTYNFEDNLTGAGFSKKQARAIVENEEAMIDHKIDKDLVTKSDLKEEIQSLRIELKEEIQSVRAELKEEIQSVREEMKDDIQLIRTDMKDLEIKIFQVQSEILKAMNMQVWKFYLGLGGLVLLLTLINKFL